MNLGVVDHTYDYQNRWISRQVDPDGAGPAGPETTHFIYDGNQIVLQFEDTDGPGTQHAPQLTNRYLWGPVVDQLFADEQLDPTAPDYLTTPGEVQWPLTDHLGSIRDIAHYDTTTQTTTVATRLTYTLTCLLPRLAQMI